MRANEEGGVTMIKKAYEYGLMTKEEYLEHRNPRGKSHSSDSYTFSVKSMNEDHSIEPFRFVNYFDRRDDFGFKIYGKEDLSAFFICKDHKTIAVAGKGTFYYIYNKHKKEIFRHPVNSERRPYHENKYVYLSELGLAPKKVKYPSDYMGLVSDIAKMNTKRFPHLVERFENKGEMFTLRSEGALEKNKGVTIGLFNEQGFKVATAQDEWGATLIGVAKEYQGRGLSKAITKLWLKTNPEYLSGGYTSAGRASAIGFWMDTVRDLMSKGFYEKRVINGEMTQERVDEILSGVSKKVKRETKRKKETEPTGVLLMNATYPSFVIYDAAYFLEQDNKFIVGYGLLREVSDVGSFYFQLDYDRKHTDLVTRIALQFAKDNGKDKLYDGKGDHYSDVLEVEGISGVREEGDYIYIEKDLIKYKMLIAKDKVYRKRIDKYGEIEMLLQEGAYAKWR
jgi:hypothetical protein